MPNFLPCISRHQILIGRFFELLAASQLLKYFFSNQHKSTGSGYINILPESTFVGQYFKNVAYTFSSFTDMILPINSVFLDEHYLDSSEFVKSPTIKSLNFKFVNNCTPNGNFMSFLCSVSVSDTTCHQVPTQVIYYFSITLTPSLSLV